MVIVFWPGNIRIESRIGESVLQAAKRADILLDGSCAGMGKCGRCKIKILSGGPHDLSDTEKDSLTLEEVRKGYRLACQVIIKSDMEVELLNIGKSHTSKRREIVLENDFSIQPGLEIGNTEKVCYGIAFDIGTTTIAGILWDISRERWMDATAKANPQITVGADVISRIQYCKEEKEHLGMMQKKLIDCCNDIIEELAEKNNIKEKNIYDITVVGNTTMMHLFLGVHPKSLARAPFTPVFCNAVTMPVSKLFLKVNKNANVYVLPGIGGHAGADLMGVMLATKLKEMAGVNLALDIGTNGEILLAKQGRVLACSTAAGPAFEGVAIYQGMRAAKGAIERVNILEGKVTVDVIGQEEPIGICGSGLMDAIAQMLEAGIVEESGRLLSGKEAKENGVCMTLASRLVPWEKGNAFVLAYREKEEDIIITQKDIREVQLAKGAIYAGIKTMMKKLEVKTEELTRIILTGAFGNDIKKESALKIGLLPEVEIERICSMPNAAGTGASMALLSKEVRNECETLKIEHVELAMDTFFQEEYIRAMNFPTNTECFRNSN